MSNYVNAYFSKKKKKKGRSFIIGLGAIAAQIELKSVIIFTDNFVMETVY